MSDKSWYDMGLGNNLNREANALAEGAQPARYYMPVNAQKDIVLVDDEAFCVYEHNPRFGGSWKNWTTCLKGVYPEDCACCQIIGEKTRYYAGYFTMIELTPWTDNKGVSHRFDLKFFHAKFGTLQKLKQKKENRGSLVGHVIHVMRSAADKAPGCGDDFEFIRPANMDTLFPHVMYRGKLLTELYQKAEAGGPEGIAKLKKVFQIELGPDGHILPKVFPFNYMEILKPKTPAEIRKWLQGVVIETDAFPAAPPVGATVGAAGAVADDDVPF